MQISHLFDCRVNKCSTKLEFCKRLFFEKMGIPLTPVRGTDFLAAWKMASRVLALITLERSKKWTSGFAVRKVAAAIRLKRVKDVSGESLLDFIREAVALGTTIHTDGWKGYIGLPAAGYKHRVTVISSGEEQVHEVMPCVHNVTSPRCSSGGCSERSRVVFNNSISITTLMNSRFASTAAAQVPADCSFTASHSKLLLLIRHPTDPLSAAPRRYEGERDTQL
jgi:hypothetical protein